MSPAAAADPSLLDAAAVAASLQTDPAQGLSAQEAALRLARDGPNALRAAARVSPWRQALAQLRSPLVLLLLGAAAVAFAAWMLEGRHGWPLDVIVIAAVVLVNAVLGLVQERKAEQAVAALARLTESTCSVVRGGVVLRVPSVALVRGDVLVLAEGDAVGADARLCEAAALHLLEASLTGESESVLKHADALPQPVALGDRANMVFKGTAVAQGSGRAVVTATGMATEVGGIATLLDATVDPPTPLQREVAQLGRVLGLAAVGIAVGVVLLIVATGQVSTPAEWVRVLLLGVSLAVAAVPEGLPAILSVVLALGVQRMALHQAIVKKLASVETLGSATVIATDKTGTLTQAQMTIVRVVTASGQADIGGVGYAPVGAVEHSGKALRDGALFEETRAVLGGGSLAGNAGLRQAEGGEWVIQGDPTEAAFLVAEHKLGTAAHRKQRFRRLGEVPFTSDRKRMSTLEADHQRQGEPVLVSKGAPAELLARCTRLRVGKGTVALDDARRERIRADVALLADAALRTLAVAYRPLHAHEKPQAHAGLERELIYAGTVGIIDPPRPEAAVAIREARAAGIRVVMITGDHPRTAVRIALDLGIVQAQGGIDPNAAALTGTQLDALDDAALAAAVRHTAVYARVAPRHKLRIVQALRAGGEVVAMTGDGVNDAPALKAADIGIAMGVAGTEVAKEAARLVLADDNFATIVVAVREGRGVLDNVRGFLRYLLSSNLGEVLTVFLGVLGAGLIGLHAVPEAAGGALVLPLLATQILWINLVTDTGPALAMGVEPIAGDTMARPPRRPDTRMISAPMWLGIVCNGVVMALATLLTIDLFLPGGLVGGGESLVMARTAGFTVLVLAQLFNCFNARSDSESAFRGLFSNPWLWGAVALSALLQAAVVHVPALNLAFGTVPLSASQWLTCLGMASLVLVFGEVRKAVQRGVGRRAHS